MDLERAIYPLYNYLVVRFGNYVGKFTNVINMRSTERSYCSFKGLTFSALGHFAHLSFLFE